MSLELKGAGAPTIAILNLTTCVGDVLDVSAQMDALVIFEDIFSPVLTGNITINDTLGLFDKVPIIGQEKLTVKFYSYNYATDNEKIDFIHRTFDVLKITNITTPTDYSKRYVLHFASPELKKNETIKISRAFQNSTLSNIVSTLMTAEYDVDEPEGLGFQGKPVIGPEPKWTRSPLLKEVDVETNEQQLDPDNSLELFVEKTKYVEPWVTFPYIKPLDAIRWICARSIRSCPGRFGGQQGEQIGFLFFENKRGFQFTSIESLIENYNIQSATTFTFGNARQNHVDDHDHMLDYVDTITRLEIQQSCYDTIKNIQHGMYASRLYTYDLSTGNLLEHDFDYIKNFNRVKDTGHTKEYPMIPVKESGEEDIDVGLSQKFMSRRIFVPFLPTRGLDNITSDTTERNNETSSAIGPEQYLQTRLSYLASLNNYRVLFEMAGNSKHKVGDSVNLDLKDQNWNAGMTHFDEISAKYYSGRYLITSIKHQVTKFEYIMTVEATKAAYKTRIGK